MLIIIKLETQEITLCLQHGGKAYIIKLKLVKGNLVNCWRLGLQVGCDQTSFMCASLSIDVLMWTSIDIFFSISTDGRARWSSRVLAPNIINRLYIIIISSNDTYKPWVKVGQIHGLSTPPDLPFCLSSSKTDGQSLWKRFWKQQGLTWFKT